MLAFKDGWEEKVDVTQKTKVHLDQSYKDDNFLTSFVETYQNSMDRCSCYCLSVAKYVNNINILTSLLPESVIALIVEYTNEQLTENGYSSTSITEYYQFIATMWLGSWFRLQRNDAFKIMRYVAEKEHFVLMEEKHYKEIVHSSTGSSINDRCGLLEFDDWIPNRDRVIST